MKKHLSVFALFARSSIYKVLLILLVMGIVESALFAYRFQEAIEHHEIMSGNEIHLTDTGNEIRYSTGTDMTKLERLITTSFLPHCFAAAFLLITLCLCLPGSEFSSQCGYTLQRLSISEKQIFLLQAIFNIIVYLLLASVQIMLCFSFCSYYAANAPSHTVSTQTVFLSFYRSNFLHSLLPLNEIALWVRNLFCCITLGLAAAEFPYKQRQRKFGGAILGFSLFNLVFFVTSIGEGKGIAIYMIVTFCILCEIIYTLFFKEAVDAL